MDVKYTMGTLVIVDRRRNKKEKENPNLLATKTRGVSSNKGFLFFLICVHVISNDYENL